MLSCFPSATSQSWLHLGLLYSAFSQPPHNRARYNSALPLEYYSAISQLPHPRSSYISAVPQLKQSKTGCTLACYTQPFPSCAPPHPRAGHISALFVSYYPQPFQAALILELAAYLSLFYLAISQLSHPRASYILALFMHCYTWLFLTCSSPQPVASQPYLQLLYSGIPSCSIPELGTSQSSLSSGILRQSPRTATPQS